MEQRLRCGSGERTGLKITERIEFAQFSHRATSKGDKCLFLAHMAVPVMFCAPKERAVRKILKICQHHPLPSPSQGLAVPVPGLAGRLQGWRGLW